MGGAPEGEDCLWFAGGGASFVPEENEMGHFGACHNTSKIVAFLWFPFYKPT